MYFAHIFKKWSREAWQASAEARRHAHMKNAQVAEALHSKFQQVKNSPDKHSHLNGLMVQHGYLNAGTSNGVTVYQPFSGDTEAEHTPTNPVIGHKVHITLDHATGDVYAVSRYKG